ncbi:JmjC domain, hydroxylase-domain-containing protein [Gaertneriomyces semiglobifer]|nr:JmjC domain, hydroxylase-domain-containing protein [Gaertneriomyces semiglobifer]
MEQFEDFAAFVRSIDEYGKKAGLVKVIPPAEWKSRFLNMSEAIRKVRVSKPIKQEITGGGLPGGAYFVMNLEQRRTYSVQDWYESTTQAPDERQEAEVKKEGTSTKRKRPKIEEDQPISFDVEEVSSGFSDDYCRELENHYWKSVTYAAPMYGADMLGSIFNNIPGAEQNKWNMAHLDNLLSRVKIPLPGVNEPYLYFGMWKASFAWHVEDMDLYSINYIHFGAPKQWYVIPPDQRHRFETVAKSTFSEEAYKCPEFLRHKTCLISPKFLSRHNVPVSRVVQKAGEFIITYPYGYHQGYNLGFNCAESVNFALDGWVEIGKKAGFCQCIGDSVKLDVAGIFDPPRGPLKIKLKLTAEPTPLLATEVDGVFAHRHCAVFIPETYVQPHPEDSTKEIVMGVASIDPARWRLKCALCKRSSKGSTKIGACIQCAKGKCPRAYHVSCAFDSDICMIPDTDGLGYRCFCPPHDPQKVEKRKAEKEKFMQEAPEKFRPGVTVFAKYDVWWLEGVVESCIASKKSCKVRFPDGFVRTIPWTGLRLTYEETLSRGSSKDNSPAISAAASRQGSVKPQALVIPSVSASLTSVPPRLVPYQAAYRFPPVSQPVLPQPVLPVSTPMLFTTYASGPNGHPAFPHPTYAQPNLYPYYTMPIYPPTMYTLPPLPSSPPRPNTPWYQAHSPANGQRYHSSPPGPDPYGVWRRNT